MTDIRRYYLPNSIVFITSVTNKRIKIFENNENINLLWDTLKNEKEIVPFDLIAYVILPDHFHWLLEFSEKFFDFSKVLKSFKWNFSLNFKKMYDLKSPITLWPRRFWDHVIRDQNDLKIHLDYIHWNPVKHGLVEQPEKWGHSSFMDWVDKGYYDQDWSWSEEPASIRGKEFE